MPTPKLALDSVFASYRESGRQYLFIDGGFLRGFSQEVGRLFGVEGPEFLVDFNSLTHEYERVFYYDSYPSKKPGQPEQEFEDEYSKMDRLLGYIAECRNCNVRPALTRSSRKREQKGVDVQLALECFMHASSGNIDVAAVMTSDLDFFPLFEAMLSTRTRSKLLYQFGKTSRELVSAADASEPLTAIDFANWARQTAGIRRSLGAVSIRDGPKAHIQK
jgi:uncharacterized LabA/DUF88 family protein